MELQEVRVPTSFLHSVELCPDFGLCTVFGQLHDFHHHRGWGQDLIDEAERTAGEEPRTRVMRAGFWKRVSLEGPAEKRVGAGLP